MKLHVRSLLTGLVLAVALTACGDDGGTKPSPVDLSGTYELMSYWEQEVGSALGSPLASGTLTLTSTGYDMTINLPPTAVPPVIDDEGDYAADRDGKITLTSGGDLGRWNGTYSFDAGAMQKGVLMLDVEGTLDRMVVYWRKL